MGAASRGAKILERGIYSASTSESFCSVKTSQVLSLAGCRSGINSALLWLTLILLALTWSPLPAATPPGKGAEIYRQMCAKCHGRNGQGVRGKYEDALRGDRSLEKLTRYIDRAMPEDDPDKCVGEDAAAVAAYIYDAFYSREARIRKNPPRVELVRLTNRQYVNTVADLLKHFTGGEGTIPAGQRRGNLSPDVREMPRTKRPGREGKI